MDKKFDDDLFEDVQYEAQADIQDDLFEDVPYGTKEEPASKTESAIRGAAQGLTFDFADEGLAGLQALYEDAKSMISGDEPKIQPQFDEQGRISNLQEMSQDLPYDRLVKEERAKFDKAREDNPITYTGSEIASGVVPALFTGGATAAAKVGQTALKEGLKGGLKTAAKESAKLGAKYGAASGLGVSEGDITTREGLQQAAKDTAIGAGIGAGAGSVLPIAAKSAGKALGKGKQFGSYLLDQVPSVRTGLNFGEKHGVATSKKINNLMEDNTRDLVKILKDNFQKLGIEKDVAQDEASKLGKTYDVTGDIQEIVDTLKAKTKGLLPEEVDKANKLIENMEEGFLRIDTKRNKLVQDLQKEIDKKSQSSANKSASSIQKAESKAIQEAEKKGIELEQLEDINKSYEDVAELPFDTQGGRIQGQKAKFKDQYYDPSADEMVPFDIEKKFISDTTPFKPSEIAVDELDNKLIGKYTNEATGETFSKESTKSRFADQDFSKLTVDELVELIPVYGNKAFEQGGDNAEVYKELYKMLRNKLPEISADLPQNKREMVKLYETMEVLGIDKNKLKAPSTADIAKLAKKLPGKMDVEKDIIERNLVEKGSDLGNKIDDVELLSNAKKYLGEGYTSPTGEFTQAGILQKSTAAIANLVGTGVGKVKRPTMKIANNINNMTDESLQMASRRLGESNNEGLKAMGRQLDAALAEEGPVRSSLIWSLSQNPAFRKKIQEALPEIDKEIGEDLGVDLSNPVNDFIEPKGDNEPISLLRPEEEGRSPSSEVVDEVSTQKSAPEKENKIASFIDKTVIGKHEGGYQNRETDKGNFVDGVNVGTNFGISAPTLKSHLGRDITTEDMKNLTRREAEEIYMNQYYKDSKINTLPEDKQEVMLDFYINSGPAAIKTVQRAAGIKADGIIGPNTRQALENMSINDIVDARTEMIFGSNKINEEWKDGLIKRSESFRTEDNEMSETNAPIGDIEGLVDEVKKVLERQMKQQGSGDTTPEFHIEQTLAAIDALPTDQVNKDALEDEVVNAQTYGDVERIKNLLDGLKNLN